MPVGDGQTDRIFTFREVSAQVGISYKLLRELYDLQAIRAFDIGDGRLYLTEQALLLLMACPYSYVSKKGRDWLFENARSEMTVYGYEDLGVE